VGEDNWFKTIIAVLRYLTCLFVTSIISARNVNKTVCYFIVAVW
jgi:hypothetical protein